MKLLSILVLLSLGLLASSAEVSISLKGSITTRGLYCTRQLFEKISSTTEPQFITKFTPKLATGTNVQSLQLWSCPEDNDFSEAATPYICENALPDIEKCQMVLAWVPTDGAYSLPKDVAFPTGKDRDLNRLILVAHDLRTGSNVDASITMTYSSTTPTHEAGVMSVGVNPKSLSLAKSTREVWSGSNCENTCAMIGDWWIISATPLLYSHGESLQALNYNKGLLRRTLYGEDPTETMNTFDPLIVGKDDVFSVHCTYDTSTLTEDSIEGGRSYESSEACVSFFNYYPRGLGIRTCLDQTCTNRSGDLSFFTNVTINYIALSLAAILVGIIIGMALTLLVQAIGGWFSANSGRFSKKNFLSFVWVNPMWWYREFEDDEELDDEAEKLVDADESKISISADNV